MRLKPTAPIPTLKPSVHPVYDSTLKVPKCSGAVALASSSSGILLDGLNNIGPGEQGNTLNH